MTTANEAIATGIEVLGDQEGVAGDLAELVHHHGLRALLDAVLDGAVAAQDHFESEVDESVEGLEDFIGHLRMAIERV